MSKEKDPRYFEDGTLDTRYQCGSCYGLLKVDKRTGYAIPHQNRGDGHCTERRG